MNPDSPILRISVDAEGQLIERWIGDRWWLYQNSAEGIVNGRIVQTLREQR